MSNALPFWQTFINLLLMSGEISVPAEFHSRCVKVRTMLENDVTGIVSTIVDYSINAASDATLKVECSDKTLEVLLNNWLARININVNGIPTGLQELAKEYYKERWAGSSLCLMRVGKWETIKYNGTSIKVPTVLWFVMGCSVYIERKNKTNFQLGTDKYFLDENKKISLPTTNEDIIIQKPFERWAMEYPSPYLVKKGVLKNWLAIEKLVAKGDQAIAKVLPYLFKIKKGTEGQFLQKDVKFGDKEIKAMVDGFKEWLKRYVHEQGKLPVAGVPFDQDYEHIVADLLPILKEDLFRQGYRAMLSGLGFIDLLEIAPSRQETRMNPKPFVTEVNAGVTDFKSMLMEVISLIISKNKLDHKKLFSEGKYLKISNTPLRINIEALIDSIRSGFVYGAVSFETYHEYLGIDHRKELERAKKEWDEGVRNLLHPHLIQNREDIPDIHKVSPAPTKKQEEKQIEKEKQPEHMQEAELKDNLEMAPYKNVEELLKKHPSMKKYPKGALEVFIKVFNDNVKKGEDYAFPVAWTALKRWMKKHGYKKVNDKWVKSEENKNE